MFGFTRLGVDTLGLPPRWFTSDVEVPTGWVAVTAGLPPLSITLQVPATVAVTATALEPRLRLDWRERPTRANVWATAKGADVTSHALSQPVAASVVVTGKLGRVAALSRPTRASVSVSSPLAPFQVGLVTPGAACEASGIVPALVAGPPGLLAEVAVTSAMPETMALLEVEAVQVSVGTTTPALVVVHPCDRASVLVSGAVGRVSLHHRSPRALVWVLPGAAWESSIATGSLAVMNAQTTGVSEYAIPALDVAVLDGEVYFLTATGLVKLSGALADTDDPYVLTGQLQPLGGQEYNAPKVTLGIKGTGAATVQTTTNENGAEQVNGEITVTLGTGVDQYEVVLGTANVARTYQVKVGLPGEARLLSSDLYINPVRHRRG